MTDYREIHTERLLMRRWRDSDRAPFVALNADPEALSDCETTSGSIHYSANHQLPDAIVRRIVEARRAEIDATAR